MRAGKLHEVIEVRRQEMIEDPYGNQIPGDVATIATLRANIIEQTTEEFIRGWGINSEALKIFRTRWLDGVTLADVIRHDGVEYNIKEAKPIGRRRGLELRCVAA